MTPAELDLARRKLSYRMQHELMQVYRYASVYASCTNPQMCALKRRGLAALKWDGTGVNVREKWILTPEGWALCKAIEQRDIDRRDNRPCQPN